MGYRVVNGKVQFIGDFNLKSNVNKKIQDNENTNEINFNKVLQGKLKLDRNEKFIISNHATNRLRKRGIVLNEFDMKNINKGINKAEKKGCKEVVIIYRDIALVTSVKNRTIITAIPNEQKEGNIFTNIDGLVII